MTGSFAVNSVAVRTADGRNVLLLEPLQFVRPSGELITVPAGALADGASIPQALWSTGLAPFGLWWLAAVVHDAMYRLRTRPIIGTRE